MSISATAQTTSHNSISQQTVTQEDVSLSRKVWDIYQKYFVENKYLNEIFHYFFVGMGFTIGAVFVLWTGKDVLREIFMHCMRR